MNLRSVRGQDKAVERLARELASGRVAHAYLFFGPPGVGKLTAAQAFAQGLVCTGSGEKPCGTCLSCRRAEAGNHPEILRLVPQGSSIKISQVRELLGMLALLPAGSARRAILLEAAESLTPEAGNALLKVLEDPPVGTVFQLLTAQPNALLPTIVSRCRKVRFLPLAAEVINEILLAEGFLADRAAPASVLAAGSLARARELAGDGTAFAARAEAIRILQALSRGRAGDALEMAARLAADPARDAVLGWLALLCRDSLVLRYTGSEKLLFNRDNLVLLQEEMPAPADSRAVMEIEATRRRLSQNANARLALEVLFLRLADRGR